MTREVSGPVAGRPASARASRLADEFARVLQGQGDGKDAAPLRGADVQEAARSPKAAHADDAADTADIADAADVAALADVAGVAAAGALAWPPALPVFGVALVPPPPPPPQPPSSSAAAAPAGSAALAAVAARAASVDAVSASAEPGAVAAAKPTTVARPDGGGEAWELSITEPDGLVLTLRAERVGASASATAATPPAWSLAINAPAAEAAALQRHAPRLAERLAARALAPAHLRIDAQHESLHGN